jgi:NADH:ubiquinone oxidoreductase subunit D
VWSSVVIDEDETNSRFYVPGHITAPGTYLHQTLQDNAKGINSATIMNTCSIISRFRLSSVCAILVASIPDVAVGDTLQDLVCLLGTLDLVLGELDR